MLPPGSLGVTLKYSSNTNFTKQATLVQNAIDSEGSTGSR